MSFRFYALLNPWLYRLDALYGDRYALAWASDNGVESTARKSLKAGAEPIVTDGASAAWNGYDSLLTLLIEHGLDVNAPVDDHQVVLIHAVYWKHLEIAKLLVDAGAQLDVFDGNRRSLLALGAYNGDLDIVRFLLQQGAKPDLHSDRAVRLLDVAAQRSHVEVLKCLLGYGAPISLEGIANAAIDNYEQGYIAFCAAGAGLSQVLAELIDRGWDVNSWAIEKWVENQGRRMNLTPLALAAKNGYAQIVRLLLVHNADPNGETDFDSDDTPAASPLQLGARQGHEDVVGLLLEHKASLDNNHFEYILTEALPHPKVFDLLLSHGAELQKLSLEPVLRGDDVGTLKLLLEAGLDLNDQDGRLEWYMDSSMESILMECNEDMFRAVFKAGYIHYSFARPDLLSGHHFKGENHTPGEVHRERT
ncbi:ankyrin repeat-containing domain protein [Aspergillus multicolor]|uniref:ankyrin repeat domain-containing protein n=1 Tax=Aspergillus multicolor TaxID=41759 RepID=UPI003CCE24E5